VEDEDEDSAVVYSETAVEKKEMTSGSQVANEWWDINCSK
jgi:hypothetical protein